MPESVVVVVPMYLASGKRASPWWGLLGPAGWVVAGLRGAHVRVDELVRLAIAQEQARVQAAQAVGAPDDEAPIIDRIVGAADTEGRALVECGACHERQRLFPEAGATARCVRCNRKIPDFARRRT